MSHTFKLFWNPAMYHSHHNMEDWMIKISDERKEYGLATTLHFNLEDSSNSTVQSNYQSPFAYDTFDFIQTTTFDGTHEDLVHCINWYKKCLVSRKEFLCEELQDGLIFILTTDELEKIVAYNQKLPDNDNNNDGVNDTPKGPNDPFLTHKVQWSQSECFEQYSNKVIADVTTKFGQVVPVYVSNDQLYQFLELFVLALCSNNN